MLHVCIGIPKDRYAKEFIIQYNTSSSSRLSPCKLNLPIYPPGYQLSTLHPTSKVFFLIIMYPKAINTNQQCDYATLNIELARE